MFCRLLRSESSKSNSNLLLSLFWVDVYLLLYGLICDDVSSISLSRLSKLLLFLKLSVVVSPDKLNHTRLNNWVGVENHLEKNPCFYPSFFWSWLSLIFLCYSCKLISVSVRGEICELKRNAEDCSCSFCCYFYERRFIGCVPELIDYVLLD